MMAVGVSVASLLLFSYGKPLIGPGLTIGSKGDPGTATTALAEWSRQFGKNEEKRSAEKQKKHAPQMQPLKNSKGASPHMKLGGANNHVHVLIKQDIVSDMCLHLVSHCNPASFDTSLIDGSNDGLNDAQDKLKARALKQGVPTSDVMGAKSKEEVIALLYEYRQATQPSSTYCASSQNSVLNCVVAQFCSDDAKAAGTLGQPSVTSKEIRAGKYDANPIDPATGKTRIWQATVDSLSDPEERAHAEAKYKKRDEELRKKQGKRDEL